MKLAKMLISHALKEAVTFLAVIFAVGSFIWSESTWMKLAGCLGAFVVSYVLSYGAAKLRGK